MLALPNGVPPWGAGRGGWNADAISRVRTAPSSCGITEEFSLLVTGWSLQEGWMLVHLACAARHFQTVCRPGVQGGADGLPNGVPLAELVVQGGADGLSS